MDELLTPKEAAGKLRVTTKTLKRWADDGLIAVVVLPNGHRRYPAEALLASAAPEGAA